MLLIVLSWITITPCGSDRKINPWNARLPASVTTNDGTSRNAMNDPWNAPSSAPTSSAAAIAISPGNWWLLPGSWSSATVTPASPPM